MGRSPVSVRKSKCQRGVPGRLAQTQSNIVFFLFFFYKKGGILLVQNVCISKKEHMVATRSGVAVGLKKAGRKKISVNK